MDSGRSRKSPRSRSTSGIGHVPCIAAEFDPTDGIYYPALVYPHETQEPPPQSRDAHRFRALFDTGAQVTCISQRVAHRLGLVPRGTGQIVSASETRETNIFLFRLMFDPAATLSTEGKSFDFGLFEGLEFYADPNDDVDVLIGMDVLARGSFHVAFGGHFTFCW